MSGVWGDTFSPARSSLHCEGAWWRFSGGGSSRRGIPVESWGQKRKGFVMFCSRFWSQNVVFFCVFVVFKVVFGAKTKGLNGFGVKTCGFQGFLMVFWKALG